MGKRIHQAWYIHIHSHMQEEILTCSIIWIQSGDVRLREINCSQKDRYYVSLFMKYSVVKLPETKSHGCSGLEGTGNRILLNTPSFCLARWATSMNRCWQRMHQTPLHHCPWTVHLKEAQSDWGEIVTQRYHACLACKRLGLTPLVTPKK